MPESSAPGTLSPAPQNESAPGADTPSALTLTVAPFRQERTTTHAHRNTGPRQQPRPLPGASRPHARAAPEHVPVPGGPPVARRPGVSRRPARAAAPVTAPAGAAASPP